MSIALLPDDVVNHIAAGEVVERPASVVRELVDNSIDAGASEISVYLEDGGLTLIRVVDNGCGMSREDALLACERHATSKVRSVEDLQEIRTLGFRGEALSSIAAVSRLKLRTRCADSPAATEIVLHAGALKDVTAAAGPVGSDIQAATLFFNVPARRKFMRQPASEERRVKQWLMHSSIAHPQVHYRLYGGGRLLINQPPAASMLQRAAAMFKGAAAGFEERWGEMTIRGVLCHPSLAQAEASALVLFVNGRLVSDRLLMKAVREGYLSTLKGSEYPLGFLALTLPPGDVDVNVHPQKSEVRFRSSRDVFAAVRQVVQQKVSSFSGALPAAPQTPAVRPAAPEPAPAQQGELSAFDWGRAAAQPGPAEQPAAPAEAARPFKFSALRYIGQALSCYLLCELDGALYVVDMHAAHERYNYNLVRNSLRERGVASQLLLVPLTLQLTETGAANCLEHQELLTRCGFEIEAFGGGAVLVRAVPVMLRPDAAAAVLKELAAAEHEAADAEGAFTAEIDHVAARIACHASIRSGDEIGREQAYALFAALDRSEFSAACPHGRPVTVSFTAAEIERWFGRDR